MRKNIIEKLSYEKVYNQGFNINTPIDLELQQIATKSLRKGLISYDQRKGWRGVILNRIGKKNWTNELDKYELEKSIGWDLAIVRKVDRFSASIETMNKLKGTIDYKVYLGQKKNLTNYLELEM